MAGYSHLSSRPRSRLEHSTRTKMLIAMAVNASTGMGYGCSEIAKILAGMGVKKQEIAEALRVASTVRAIQGVVTGSEAYKL